MATNTTPESFEQNRARVHCAYMRKRNEVATAIAADDEFDIVVWISEECKELWKVAESKYEDYISTLNQTNEELLQKQETWLAQVQQNFLELERMKVKYQKKIKHQADKILYKQEKRNGQQQQIRQ